MTGPAIQGVYFHTFTGAYTGTEWSQIAVRADGTFRVADLAGGGADARWAEADGRLQIFNGASGSGQCAVDACTVNWVFPGALQFNSSFTRVPFTTSDFPIRVPSPVAGDPSYAGTWTVRIESRTPGTGQVISSESLQAALVVDGTTLRLTLPGDVYYQGDFATSGHVGFRITYQGGAENASGPGSASSDSRTLLGEIRFTGAGAFEGTLLLEQRQSVGSTEQLWLRLTGSR